MRRIQLILLLLGIGLFVLVVHRVGLGDIARGLGAVGWSFLGIFAVELVIDALHSEGWLWCLPARSRISRLRLLAARTAGFAVNALTPTATVGGEVVKGMLIRRWVPLVDGFASVMVDKLSFAVGQAVFLLVGLVTVFEAVPFNARERQFAVVAVVVWVAAVGAFFALQRFGILRTGFRVMRALFGGAALVGRLPGHAAAFDARVTSLLTTHRFRFLVSVFFHVLGQAARTLQFWMALTALGFDPGITDCFTTAGGLVFIEATLFLVPGKLGVLEGGHVVIFSVLGYGAAAGLTVSFALRLSELASALLGLGALGYFHFRYPATQGPPEEAPAAPQAAAGSQRRKATS
ncbi:MAG: lysylphosphatidylglycerol synthase domain-containing protein [Candidatus Binatia bacterium]